MATKYPKVNYIGNKEKLAGWICDNFPADTKSVFDAFSGGASLAYLAKERGLKVTANDVLKINYHIAKALVENNDVRLSEKDIDVLFSGKPKKGFMFKNYADKYFLPSECMELDRYRENVELLDSEYKQSLALVLLRRAMIRKMPYSRFNLNWEKIKQLRDEEYSYLKYKRKRAYHNESIKSHFIENLPSYNNSVFRDKKTHIALNGDIFDILPKVKADLIYLDPPYAGTMNNYHGFYGVLDSYIDGQLSKPFPNNFTNKAEVMLLFDKLFANLDKFKYWALSYNNNAFPNKEDLLILIGKYRDDITLLERDHNYQITGKEQKRTNKEYLFIVK